MINKKRLKGSPNIMLADCTALSAASPPATSSAQATPKMFACVRIAEKAC